MLSRRTNELVCLPPKVLWLASEGSEWWSLSEDIRFVLLCPFEKPSKLATNLASSDSARGTRSVTAQVDGTPRTDCTLPSRQTLQIVGTFKTISNARSFHNCSRSRTENGLVRCAYFYSHVFELFTDCFFWVHVVSFESKSSDLLPREWKLIAKLVA